MNTKIRKSAVRRMIILILSFVVGVGSIHVAFAQGTQPASPLASTFDAGFATQWIQMIYNQVKAEKVDAPGGSRVYAYVGITLYEAVAPGIPNDVSLSTQLKGMPEQPALDAAAVYDWPSVANSALQVVTDSLLTTDDTHKSTAALRDKQAAARETVVGKAVVQRSLARGEIIGKAIAAWAATDGA